MTKKKLVIAIDGYSSCGKSTVAKALAHKLNFVYVDSGAMYRAVTYYFLENNVDLQNPKEIDQALQNIHIDLQNGGTNSIVLLNDVDISKEIREMRISERVSDFSSIKAIRSALVKQQQAMALRRSIVMDGRDIGTVVFPHAQVKIFMTADPKVRADRRYKELKAAGQKVSLEEVFENIAHRDFQDTTRKESPLKRAKDAIILDNTNLNEREQLNFVINEVAKHCPECVEHIQKAI
jgi:cytidylate kinase